MSVAARQNTVDTSATPNGSRENTKLSEGSSSELSELEDEEIDSEAETERLDLDESLDRPSVVTLKRRLAQSPESSKKPKLEQDDQQNGNGHGNGLSNVDSDGQNGQSNKTKEAQDVEMANASEADEADDDNGAHSAREDAKLEASADDNADGGADGDADGEADGDADAEAEADDDLNDANSTDKIDALRGTGVSNGHVDSAVDSTADSGNESNPVKRDDNASDDASQLKDAPDLVANRTGRGDAIEDEDEDEDEDDHNGQLDQASEAQRQKAIQLLTEIEVDFAKLRDRLHDDKMARFVAEIEMCADGTHPELERVSHQVGQIRDQKVQLATKHHQYQRQCIDNQTRATRVHLHQQFLKDASDARSKMLLSTTEQWYNINRERRAMDCMVPNYTFKIPSSRSDQIRDRQAIYDEISALMGLNKYVGFPAAPEMRPLNEEDIEDDLEALGLRH